MLGHVRRIAPYMAAKLARFSAHPLVGDVRGVGLLWGMELVEDKERRKPFDPARRVGQLAQRHAREAGLIARFIGDRIAFSPPLIIGEQEVDEIADRLGRALDQAWAEIKQA